MGARPAVCRLPDGVPEPVGAGRGGGLLGGPGAAVRVQGGVPGGRRAVRPAPPPPPRCPAPASGRRPRVVAREDGRASHGPPCPATTDFVLHINERRPSADEARQPATGPCPGYAWLRKLRPPPPRRSGRRGRPRYDRRRLRPRDRRRQGPRGRVATAGRKRARTAVRGGRGGRRAPGGLPRLDPLCDRPARRRAPGRLCPAAVSGRAPRSPCRREQAPTGAAPARARRPACPAWRRNAASEALAADGSSWTLAEATSAQSWMRAVASAFWSDTRPATLRTVVHAGARS